MSKPNLIDTYQENTSDMLQTITPILSMRGYSLDDVQPHLGGERYLMQAATTDSGFKLILLGEKSSNHERVVIKISNDPDGKQELTRERHCRQALHQIDFAYQGFNSPEEVDWFEENSFLFSIQAFITQKCQFIDRPIAEQFTFALNAFKAQAGVHATTARHQSAISDIFHTQDAAGYLNAFASFCDDIKVALPEYQVQLQKASDSLAGDTDNIERYCGILTHTDFVPHNFRIANDTMYLLDYSSLRFGNKYEGWARFMNFMALYNPALTEALHKYVLLNRSVEEQAALRLMRIYRLGEIMWYYTDKLPKSHGDLYTLNRARIDLYSVILQSVLTDSTVSAQYIENYKKLRNELRSESEIKRQQGLH